MSQHPVIPVILSGGVGSRLWPVSRAMHPKPFIRLSDGQSLLQKAFLRGAQLPDVMEILTVTNRELFFMTQDEYRQVNANGLPTSFLLEPVGRNTAAAIAVAVLHVIEKQPDAVLLVLPADHLIQDQTAFASAVEEARRLAEQGSLVTFGVKPNAPETGYGYIEADGNRVLRFVEKPDAVTAAAYLETKRYFWNSGMFCFKASSMLEEMRQHCPSIIDAARTCLAKSFCSESKDFTNRELAAEYFEKVPEGSIDYAIMEKSSRVTVVPCNIGWSDIGSWSALSEISVLDENGKRAEGEVLLHDVENCFIRTDGRLVGAVGVNDLIIVDTPDALLVADKTRAQDVKYLYNQLKASGHEAHKLHRTVQRPWGGYTVLEEGDGYKIKRIVVKPSAA
jgi:mannose-1-phosphate guanylyltransferase/mannose-6-phosphate isomerase